MKTFRFLLNCSLVSLATIGTLVSEIRAADPPAKEAKEPEDSSPTDELAKKRQEVILKAMQKYEVVMDGNADKRATLDTKALLRWSNPTSDVADGLMSVYSADPAERPAMIAHIYVHGSGQAVQEFADVHPGQVELFRGPQKVWSPASRYSKFEKLPDGPKPADSPALRLSQMKKMVARFEIIDAFRESGAEPKPQVLRMMSRPTYRYGKPEGEIIDGALFTFVVATDPEACVLIEIHRKGDVTSWEYMVLPMTIYALDAKLDGKTVWTKPDAHVFGNPTAPHYISLYQHDPGEKPFGAFLPAK